MDECQCVIPKQAFTFFRIRLVRLLCSGRLAVCTERDGPFVGEEREGTGAPFSCVQSEVARTKECVPGVRTRANGKCIFDAVPYLCKDLTDDTWMEGPFHWADSTLAKRVGSAAAGSHSLDCLEVDPVLDRPHEDLPCEHAESRRAGAALLVDVGHHC